MLGFGTAGLIITVICAAIGFVIGTLKVPESNAFEITKKTGGENIDDVILRWIKFKKNGNTKFVRYSEAAEMYHMSVSKFMQMAKDAKAIYKLGQLVLVNLKIFDEYIETFHIVDDEFYK